MSEPIKQYNKAACTPAQLLTHLKAKSLIVPDDDPALKAIQFIGYYRLLIYMRPFQDAAKVFQAGATFDDVLNVYNFDRKLRIHCLNAIERIEVALRASIINKLSIAHGPHFYTESRHYLNIASFKEFMGATQKANYLAIDHYNRKYNTPSLPPIWAVAEGITYGTLSRFYSNLHIKNQKLIAQEFGFNYETLISWFRSLTVIRNMCAHHNRLWNFQLQVNKPSTKKELRAEFPVDTSSFFARAIVINALLRKIDPASTWHTELRTLIGNHNINAQDMGFPVGWETRAFWI